MSFSSNGNKAVSVVIVGASGRTGNAVIQALAKQQQQCDSNPPAIHAFCRDASKLSTEHRNLCTSVQTGNARKASDIEQALKATKANWIVISIGNGDSVSKNDIRQVSAEATVEVLQKPQFQHVRALVISSSGAGTSKIVVGMGLGKLISFHLRHILADHTRQEAVFLLDKNMRSRTIVVRPTSLTQGAATGHLAEFGDEEKGPSIKTDREDLATWVAREICGSDKGRSGMARVINTTSIKQ